MSLAPEALWLNVSPALQKFDRPLLNYLAKQELIAEWQYCQTPDEPASLEIAIGLLEDYLQLQPPLHLLGHGTGGLLGLLYARQYPERVRSLTMLAVGPSPAIDWQTYYYRELQRLPCNRETVLTQMVYKLFGYQSRPTTLALRKLLEQDLISSLSPHNLYRPVSISPGSALIPLLVCHSLDDLILDKSLFKGYQNCLKAGDRLWHCPNGRYFFHYFYPQQVGEQIVSFWHTQDLFKQVMMGGKLTDLSV